MSSNLKPRVQAKSFVRPDLSAVRSQPCKKEITLGFKHIVLVWGLMLIMLLLVFAFGFNSGRTDGFTTALERYGEHTARLPIVRPVGGDETTGLSTKKPSADKGSQKKKEVTEQPIDFTQTSKIVKQKGDTRKRAPRKKTRKNKEVSPSSAIADKPASSKASKVILTPEQTKVTSGWYVQIAAKETEEEMLSLVGRLRQAGIDPRVERAQVRSRQYFRILVGPFPDRSAAVAEKDKIRKAKHYFGEPFVRYVQ